MTDRSWTSVLVSEILAMSSKVPVKEGCCMHLQHLEAITAHAVLALLILGL